MENAFKFNWNEEWKKRIALSPHRRRLAQSGISAEEFWSQFDSWDNLHQYTEYPGELLGFVIDHVSPDYSILDVGAGNGAFAVPLAKTARSVTAIEPSAGQVARLLSRANSNNINNLKVIQKRWEQVNPAELEKYDLVLASYCFMMDDIRLALEKICSSSRRWVFLIHLADHDLLNLLKKTLSWFERGPDYIYLYNILYEMGYRPEVSIIDRHYRIPLDFQMDMFTYSFHLTREERARLETGIKNEKKLIQDDGKLWIEREHRDAIISLQLHRKGGL